MLSTMSLQSLANSSRKKLPRWVLVVRIVEGVRSVAADLHLPSDRRFHQTFHVSVVHPYRGSVPTPIAVDIPSVVEADFSILLVCKHQTRKTHFKLSYTSVLEGGYTRVVMSTLRSGCVRGLKLGVKFHL